MLSVLCCRTTTEWRGEWIIGGKNKLTNNSIKRAENIEREKKKLAEHSELSSSITYCRADCGLVVKGSLV